MQPTGCINRQAGADLLDHGLPVHEEGADPEQLVRVSRVSGPGVEVGPGARAPGVHHHGVVNAVLGARLSARA